MSAVHEIFSPIAELDPEMAATCSEIFDGEYHYVQSEETASLYGQGAELLTNPTVQLVTAQACYVEETASRGRQTPFKFATLGRTLPSLPEIHTIHQNTIGRLQRLGNTLHIAGLISSIPIFKDGGWEATKTWSGNEVARRERTLMAAHFIGRVAGDNEALVDTLVYPAQLRESLRLLIRDVFVADMLRYGEKFTSDMREQLLDNEALYGLAADITAAKYFPTSNELQKFLRIYIKQLSN